MYVAVRSASDSLFVDYVRPNADARNNLGPHVRRPGEEAAVPIAHVATPVHDDVALGILDHHAFGVAGNKTVEIMCVVRAYLALDGIFHRLSSRTGSCHDTAGSVDQ